MRRKVKLGYWKVTKIQQKYQIFAMKRADQAFKEDIFKHCICFSNNIVYSDQGSVFENVQDYKCRIPEGDNSSNNLSAQEPQFNRL